MSAAHVFIGLMLFASGMLVGLALPFVMNIRRIEIVEDEPCRD